VALVKTNHSAGGGTGFAFDYCTFDACGYFGKSLTIPATIPFSFKHTRFKNSADTINFNWAWAAPNAGVARVLGQFCAFDKDINNGSDGMVLEDSVLGGNLNSTYASGAWSSVARLAWRGVPVGVATAVTSSVLWGDVSDVYFLADDAGQVGGGNPHMLTPAATLSSLTASGVLFDYPYANLVDGGDCVYQSSAGPGTGVFALTHCIVLPSYEDGNMSGSFPNIGGGGWDIRITHCTVHAGSEGSVMTDEAGGNVTPAGTFTQFKSNVVWVQNGFPSTSNFGPYKCWDVAHYVVNGGGSNAVNNGTTDVVTPAGCVKNYGWNMKQGQGNATYGTAGQGYNLKFSAAPGTTDIDTTGGTGPNFVDSSRCLVTWAVTVAGSTASTTVNKVADGFAALAADPRLVSSSLLPWVRAGFAPRNTALRNAGHDGATIGAVEGVWPGGGRPGLRAGGAMTGSGLLTGGRL